MNLLAIFLLCIFEAGNSSLVFLKNLKDAQDIALGETGVALPCDALSFLSNPALLAGVKKYEASFYSALLWDNIKEEFVVFAGRTPYFSYGIAFNYLNYGEIERRDTFGFKTGSFTPYDLAIHLGFARNFSKFLKLGFSFGYAQEEIDKERGSSILFSFGGKYILEKNPSFKFGFSILNLGSSLKFAEKSFLPPFILKLGTFYKKLQSPYLLSAEIAFPFDDIPYISMGGGYKIKDIFEIRGGFKSSFDTGIISAFRLGFGLEFPFLIIDYAFTPQGVLGFTHHIDLKFRI